jgi:PAS domain-containing protein
MATTRAPAAAAARLIASMPVNSSSMVFAAALAAAAVGLLVQRRRLRSLRSKAESRARDQDAWLHAILGGIAEPVAVLNDEWRFVGLNDAFAGLVAMAPRALLDARAEAVLPADRFAAICKGECASRPVHPAGEGVEPWLTGDDGRLWRLNRRRIEDPHGRSLVLIHAREVTDLALTRKAFAAQQDPAAVGSLTAVFAHGANNRLTVILSCLEMIGTVGLHGEDADHAMELASGAARRLAEDTSALLAGVRRQVPRPETIHLRESVLQASKTFTQLPGLELQVTVHIADSVELYADPDRVEAAILRLLSFARRRGASSVTLTADEVVIEARRSERPRLRKGRYCRLDTELVGATLSERLLRVNPEPGQVTDRLFDPDGLELAAVEGFVVAMRGQLEVHADPGTHPRIRLYLPYAAAA